MNTKDVVIDAITPTPREVRNGTSYVFSKASSASCKTEWNTVVCVHGIGSYSLCFESIVQKLVKEGYNVLTYDLLGRGHSAFPDDGKFDSDAHVNQLRRLIVDLDLCGSGMKYHLLAHSMGGALATIYASQHIDEVASCTLLSPAGLMDIGIVKVLRGCCGCFQGVIKSALKGSQEAAWRKDFVATDGDIKVISDKWIENLHAINKTNPRHFDAFFESVLAFPLSGIEEFVQILQTHNIPVLLMWGKLDKAVPYQPNHKRWLTLLTGNNSASEEVNNETNKFIEHSSVVNQAILEFLNNK